MSLAKQNQCKYSIKIHKLTSSRDWREQTKCVEVFLTIDCCADVFGKAESVQIYSNKNTKTYNPWRLERADQVCGSVPDN